MLKFFGHWMAILATLSLSFSQPVVAQNQGPNDELLERLADAADILDDIGDVAASAADLPGSVIDLVGADADSLVDYVGARIGYLPYTGVLRGADGTLRSGYGNSYDQSLALITLLRRAGFEAQILVGPSTEGEISTARTPLSIPVIEDELQDLLEELEELVDELVADDLVEALPSIAVSEASTFDPDVGKVASVAAMGTFGTIEAPDFFEDQQMYAIVRYRDGPSDAWTYADPAKNAVISELETSPYAKLNNNVPAEHLHYTEIRIIVESDAFGSVVAAQTSAPSSLLAAEPISFGIVPSAEALGIEGVSPFDPSQDLILGSNTLPQVAISLNGQALDVQVAASVMAGVFKTGAGLMGDAISTLDQEEPSEAPLLNMIKLQIVTMGPKRQNQRTAERILLDRARVEAAIGTDEQATLRSAMLAAASGSALLHSGISPRAPAERDFYQLVALAEILEGLIDDPSSAEGPEKVVNFASLILRDELARALDDTDQAAHTSTSIAMIQTVRLPGGTDGVVESNLMTDIVLDGRRALNQSAALALAVDTAGREQDMLARVATALEYEPSRTGSYASLQSALDEGIAPVSFESFIASQAAEPDPERSAQIAFLSAQQDAGMQLAIWPGATTDETVWLEYDTDQGYARLASGTGAGSDTAEKLLLEVNIALYLTVINLANCAAKASSAAPGATQNCLTCTGIKFSLALAGVATLGFGAAAMLGASNLIIEASCL